MYQKEYMNYYHIALLAVLFTSLSEAAIKEITSQKEYQEVIGSGSPYVLMFYSPGCGACTSMKTPYESASNETSSTIFTKIDVTNKNNKDLTDTFAIRAVPTFIAGRTGTLSKEELKTMLPAEKVQKSVSKK